MGRKRRSDARPAAARSSGPSRFPNRFEVVQHFHAAAAL